MGSGDQINLKLLLEGCRKGQRVSQLKVYRHFYGYGMSVCLRYSKSREEALEIVNDGFLRAFTKIEQYDSDFDFKPWLRKILIHSAIDYHRKYNKLKQPLEFIRSSDQEPAVANEALNNLAYEDAVLVLQKLPPAYRLVFNLFVLEELSHQDIAERLGISVGTSKSNLAKARKKLKILLSSSDGIHHKSMGHGR